MEFHEVANILPLMAAPELAELAEDIRRHGQREAIYTHDGKILDGRNRYLACMQIGIEPKFRKWKDDGSLTAFVMSENLWRRHLSTSQKAMVAVDAEAAFAKEAKKRLATSTGGKTPQPKAKLPEAAKGQARDKAAKAAGVGARSVSKAKAVKAKAPALAPLVVAGKLSLQEAELAATLPAADLAVIVKEMNAGASLQKAATKLEKNPLPGPAEARRQAIATGKPVLASNNRVINPITQKEQDRVDDEVSVVSGFAEAVERIASCSMPPKDMRKKLIDWYLADEFNLALPKAISYLAQFKIEDPATASTN